MTSQCEDELKQVGVGNDDGAAGPSYVLVTGCDDDAGPSCAGIGSETSSSCVTLEWNNSQNTSSGEEMSPMKRSRMDEELGEDAVQLAPMNLKMPRKLDTSHDLAGSSKDSEVHEMIDTRWKVPGKWRDGGNLEAAGMVDIPVKLEVATVVESLQLDSPINLKVEPLDWDGYTGDTATKSSETTVMQPREEWCGEIFMNNQQQLDAGASSSAETVELNVASMETNDESEAYVDVEPASVAFACPQCPGRKFKGERSLRHHMKMHHVMGDVMADAAASRGTSEEGDFDPAKQELIEATSGGKTLSPKKRFKCPKCPKRYMNKTSLNAHMKRPCDVDGDGTPQYKCEKCGKRYTHKRSLQSHVKVCCNNGGSDSEDEEDELGDVEKPHKCPECPLRYMNKTSMVRHRNSHRKPKLPPTPRSDIKPEDKIHKCTSCDRRYKHKTHLTRHMRVHDTQKRLVCEDCGLHLASNDEYKRHRVIHTGVRAHKCDVCNMTFRTSYHLKSHSYKHLAVAAYECATCHKRFRSPMLLKSHQLVHSELKKFKCPKCDCRFHRKSEVRSHERSHIHIKPFRCCSPGCGKAFKSLMTCNQHIERHRLAQTWRCVRCNEPYDFMCAFEKHVRECEKNKSKLLRAIEFKL